MSDLCVPSDAKLQDVLSIPAPFSIAPSGQLSVAELLLLNLHTISLHDLFHHFKQRHPFTIVLAVHSETEIIVQQMQASDLQFVSVETLDFADILWLNEKWWNNYETDKAFIRLCTIGSALHDGTLHRILFPININNVHWAVIEVNTVNQNISYADSLDWSWPNDNINTINCWLGYHGFGKFDRATTLQHGEQRDSFSCGITAINIIKHALFHDTLFTDNRAFSLRMEEFLYIAYDHLELSDPNNNSNDGNGSYSDSNNFEIETQLPSLPNSTSAKPKLNLCASDADRSAGLFQFFLMISHDEHLKFIWKPAPALKDWEQQELVCYQRRMDIFEKTAWKHERANKLAATRVGYGMSPIEIERELKQVDPSRFCGIFAQVIGRWIDHSGTQPVWHANVLACVQKGNLPLTTGTPPSILSKYPNVTKAIIEDLCALHTVGVALDTMCCCGLIIARLAVSCPEIFEATAKDGSSF
ncbi:uncharacterized protein EDB93DRAFT_1099873 [Suillus bovinus]|uniref:uncharacterized protein n=1 Tax=Suillus bovinus TaxID=48563 RepID=UPI001B884E31|nr:uncharacterized protein EDB93DRAFT_1099873 [Suillus bovinus]KAG2159523.1 hypothetical protein EDB93DRAFT_1099873 [Suillus bovinus]